MKQLFKTIMNFMSGLVAERTKEGTWKASLGKISWWVAFIPAIVIWIKNGAQPGEYKTATRPSFITLFISFFP